jgi:hypothetical protein
MNSDLLNDVLKESDYGEFRDQLEKQFRARVARKSWRRRAAWLGAAAAIVIIALLNLLEPSKQQHVASQTIPAPLDRVPTITTSDMKFDDLLLHATDPVPVIRTHAFTAEVMRTDHSEHFPSISDDDLLRFFANHPTGLMAAHGEKRFIFIDAADAKRFMSSN